MCIDGKPGPRIDAIAIAADLVRKYGMNGGLACEAASKLEQLYDENNRLRTELDKLKASIDAPAGLTGRIKRYGG